MNPVSTDARARRLVEYIAFAVATIAILTILGWLSGIAPLVQIAPSYPPIRFNTGVGFLGAAAGLWGLGRGKRAWVMAGSAVTLLIGGLTLIEHVTDLDLGIDNLVIGDPRSIVSDTAAVRLWPVAPGRMPAAAALNLLLTGVAFLGLTIRSWERSAKVVGGTIGTLIAGTAAAALLAYATGVLSNALRFGPVTSFAINTAVGFVLLGAGLVVYSWRDEAMAISLPAWIPWAAGATVLVITGLLWRALSEQSDRYEAVQLESHAEAIAKQLDFRIDNVTRVLRRVSARVTDNPSLDAREWGVTTNRIVSDLVGLSGIVSLDSSLAIRSVQPSSAATDPVVVRLARMIHKPPAAAGIAGPMHVPAQAYLDTSGASPLIVWAIPNCGIRCVGYTVGLIRPDTLIREAVADAVPGYAVNVAAGPRTVYQTPGAPPSPSDVIARRKATMGPLDVDVSVWALPGTVPAVRSDLPTVVAGLGIVVSMLLAATLQMVRSGARAARLAERERLSRALETDDDSLWEINLATGEGSRNPSVWRRLGYDPADLPRTGQESLWSSLIHPEDRPGVVTALDGHITGKAESFEVEYRLKGSGGDWHWIIDRGRIVEYDDQARPLRMLGVSADITERRQADQALIASERRFRTMFDSGFQIKHLLDLDCSVLEANRTALDFVASELAQVRGLKAWDSPWWSNSPAAIQQIKDGCAKAGRGETVRYESELRGADGRRVIIDFSVKPILDAGGKVTQLLVEGRDITDLKRSQDIVREMAALSTMGRLAAKVAHEINNPLAGIQNAFLLIKDAIPPSHPYYRYVGAIDREVARIGAVTRQLYETYRPESDDTEVSSVPSVLNDAVALLEQVNRSTRVTIQIDADRAPAVLAIPSGLLRQVVYNLVQNAIEASPTGGQVTVRAWAERGAFWLTVADQRPGVTPEMRERVFDSFGSNTVGLRTMGMGLGLAIVRRAVESVGGDVKIYDGAEGGAEFRVRIPLDQASTAIPLRASAGPSNVVAGGDLRPS